MSGRLLVTALLSAGLFVTGGEPRLAASPDLDTCIAKAREQAAKALQKGATAYDARRQLEADFVSCNNPSMKKETALFIGTINADLAQFGEQFLLGHLTATAYRNARTDRSRKLRAFGDDFPLHKDFRRGDVDGDLIPDRRDRCPRTAAGVPTDDAGCPTAMDTRPPVGSEPDFRRLLGGLTLLRNDACENAPEPRVPKPFRYGRANPNAPLPPGSLMFVMSQVSGMPDGCEMFYEIRLRFIDPVDSNAPDVASTNVVFSESEDLDSDPNIALFGLPVGQPLSPGRTATFEAFKIYQRVKWKARAVVGGPLTSPWSALALQKPEVGGVP
jgi:hypothetical protein